MLAILIGGHLYNFWGMLLAIPSTCVLKVLFDRWYKSYKQEEKTETSKESAGEKAEDEKEKDIKKEEPLMEVKKDETGNQNEKA